MDYVIAPGQNEDDNEDEANENNDSQRATSKEDMDLDPLRELLDPDDIEKAEQNRLKRAYVASEILSSETWSILDSITQNPEYLRDFWSFLRRHPPLDSMQASYFTKVNESLFSRKTDSMLEFFTSLDGIVADMLQHVDNAMVMDLLLKIISLEKAEGGQGIVDWLKSRDLIPTLLSFLSREWPASMQTAAGDFLKAIITISANATQNDQTCIGPNSLTRQLVSAQCVETLIAAMLQGGNPLTVGVGIVIEVIRKNNSDYDPENVGGPDTIPTTYDPIYLGTLLRLFANRIPDFMELIRSSKHNVIEHGNIRRVERGQLNSAWGARIEPLGFDRFKTCELMAELLHCSNMGLLNEPGSEDYVRQRDAEREKLTATIYLPRDTSGVDLHDETTDFGHDSTLSAEAPRDSKPTEGIGAGEEDGFEDVSSSGVLVEGEKETENHEGDKGSPKMENFTAAASETTEGEVNAISVQEPSLESKDDSDRKLECPEASQPSGPVSPTTSLVDKFDKIRLDEERKSSESTSGPQESKDILPEKQDDSTQIPSQPEDTPKTVSSPEQQAESSVSDIPSTDYAPAAEASAEEPATCSGPNSANDEHSRRTIQLDINGQPVVGDYLKITFVENQVVPTILGFFFRFPWNNFLHNVVYDVVQQVFNGPMERGYNRVLAIDVFRTGRITQRIVEGQRCSDESEKTKHMRLGYMGHLTLIAEEVVKFSERLSPDLLTDSVMDSVLNEEWVRYVEQTLSETRERDNAILGGVRPELSMGQRQAIVNAAQGYNGSSTLADAGLNGDLGSSFQGFDMVNQGSISGGVFNLGGSGNSLLSGFGSSSDEDDDELEEQDDRIETDNATDGSPENGSSNSTSQPIPILPPPPAPLSTGPSRARRQFAARLAQKQQASESAEGDDEGEAGTHGNDNAEDQWPSNPFVIAGIDDDGNNGESPSAATFPSNFQSSNRDDIFLSSPFPDAGFSPPDSLSTNSSDECGEGRTESVRRTVRVPLEVDDEDEEMGEMVGPSLSVGSGMMDSDEEDEAIINESLGYSNLFSVGKYKGYHGSHALGSNFDDEDQNDSSDGEDDGLVEILVPGRKSSTSSR